MTLEATLDVTVDDVVVFQFRVRNVGDGPIELQFRSGQIADVAVFENEQEVWRWSDSRMFTQTMQSRTLAPGDAIDEQFTWDSPRPGAYTAVGTLAADWDAESTTRLTI